MNLLGQINETPIWLLTSEQIDSLSVPEQRWVRDHLNQMKKDGSLALILANPPGTKYETVWDKGIGWKLRPIIEPSKDDISLAVKAMRAVIRAEQECCNPDSEIDYSEAIEAATKLCVEALERLDRKEPPK